MPSQRQRCCSFSVVPEELVDAVLLRLHAAERGCDAAIVAVKHGRGPVEGEARSMRGSVAGTIVRRKEANTLIAGRGLGHKQRNVGPRGRNIAGGDVRIADEVVIRVRSD